MNGKMIAMAIVVALAASALMIIPFSEESDATDTSFNVVDGRGETINFTAPTGHVITIGKGVTATTIQLGYLDKIVVCDTYSNQATEAVFNGLHVKVEQGDVAAGGSIYSSGSAQLKLDVVDAADTNKFNKTSDALILTGSQTYLGNGSNDGKLIDYFSDLGFTKILVWYDNQITTYEDIVEVAEGVSLALSGSISPKVMDMVFMAGGISGVLEYKNITEASKKEAFYVTYSSNQYKVGNTGSLATAMIQAAGGKVVTIDASKTTSTYAVSSLTDIIEDYGTDTVIFVDATIGNSDDRMTDVRSQTNGATIVKMNSLWNNYTLESADGVWTMACTLYPEYFSNETPIEYGDDDKKDNTLVYIAGGVIAVALIGGAAFVLMIH